INGGWDGSIGRSLPDTIVRVEKWTKNVKQKSIDCPFSETGDSGKGRQGCERGAEYREATAAPSERYLYRDDHGDQSGHAARDECRKRPNDPPTRRPERGLTASGPDALGL